MDMLIQDVKIEFNSETEILGEKTEMIKEMKN